MKSESYLLCTVHCFEVLLFEIQRNDDKEWQGHMSSRLPIANRIFFSNHFSGSFLIKFLLPRVLNMSLWHSICLNNKKAQKNNSEKRRQSKNKKWTQNCHWLHNGNVLGGGSGNREKERIKKRSSRRSPKLDHKPRSEQNVSLYGQFATQAIN